MNEMLNIFDEYTLKELQELFDQGYNRFD